MQRPFLVLTQYRPSARLKNPYKDLVGVLYHFPQKYLKPMKSKGAEFVYYEPAKHGEDVYFGKGIIGEVSEDPEVPGRYFAKIEHYQPFAAPVPFSSPDSGEPIEHKPNKQNSVRVISKAVFDQVTAMGGSRVAFVSDAHLMRVLGEHLISSEKVGILELVKNAYDANARTCTVRIESVPNQSSNEDPEFQELADNGPVIAVWDTGSGMDEDRIRNGWCRPATIDKTFVKQELKQAYEKGGRTVESRSFEAVVKALIGRRGGRIPLGEKGVGRFAAHRLGRFLWLRTKTAASPLEIELRIDWDEFDKISEQPRDLDSIQFSLRTQKPTWNKYSASGSGTVLVIYGGREGYGWDKAKLKDIDAAISTFKSPTKGPSDFSIDFQCPHLPPSEKLLNPVEWDSPLELTALVDEEGNVDGDITFTPPPILSVPMAPRKWPLKELIWDEPVESPQVGETRAHPRRRAPQCGPFYVRIRFWIRQRDWMTEAEYETIPDYLQARGGISIYRDGLAVIPAALIAERDWLGLSVRGRKKASKVSYYNMLGEVELLQAKNVALIDTTSRENMLDTTPFQDLGRLVKALVLRLENVYREVRSDFDKKTSGPIPDAPTLRKEAKAAAAVMGRLAKAYDFANDPLEFGKSVPAESYNPEGIERLGEVLQSMPEWLEQKEDEQEGLMETSGFAISVSVSLHEITKLASGLYQRAAKLDKHLKKDSSLKGEVGEIAKLASALLDEMRRLEPLRITRIEPPNVFDLEDAVRSAFGIFSLRCREMGIEVTVPKTFGTFRVFGRYGATAQVFANLLDNALYWISRNPQGSKSKIAIEVAPQTRRVIFADTGPGIDPLIRPNLFRPFYSLKQPPSGLGLFIAKHYMAQLRATIRLAEPAERLDGLAGAQFLLDFSRTPDAAK